MKSDRRIVRLPMVVGGLAIALTLAACGSSTSSESTPAAPAAASEAPAASSAPAPAAAAATGIDVGTGMITPTIKDNVAFLVQATDTYSYGAAQAAGAKAAGEELGVNVDVYFDALDAALELSQFQQGLTSGKYGAVVMHPFTSQVCKQIETDSVKYQVLVLIVGNAVCNDGTGSGEALWAPGSISYMGGQNNVDGITNLLNSAAELSPGPQKVLLAMGLEGHPSVVAWETAFAEFQKTHPEWELAGEVFSDFTAPGSFTAVQNFLQGNPGVTVAFSPYVDVTQGLVKAIDAQGLQDKIAVYDNGGGSKVSVDQLNAGQQIGTLPVYPYSLGYEGVKLAVAALNGKQPPRFIGGDGNPDAIMGALTKDDLAGYTPQW